MKLVLQGLVYRNRKLRACKMLVSFVKKMAGFLL